MSETQIVAKKPTAIATLRDLLEKSKSKFQDVIPKHLSADRLVRVAIVACSRTPKLLLCTPVSVLNSVMQAAQLGLEPGGPLGDAYLVPYKDTCQLIVGYRGLISLARRSGKIESLEAHVVHSKDRFVCRYGLAPVLEHEPDWSENPGPPVAVYAVAKLKDGGTQSEVMTKAQIDAIRSRSRASGEGPWVSDYDEMARKTVVRRLCKYLPLSVEVADALDEDARAEFGPSTPVIEIPTDDVPAIATTTSQVKAKLAAKDKLGSAKENAADATAHNARVAQIRAEAKANHGDDFIDAWADACANCADGKPSTQWGDREILAVTEYLSTWRRVPVEDNSGPPDDDEPGREPGEEG